MTTVRIIGAPTDYGANRRGVDMGPSAIRYAGLADQLASAGVETVDAGDLAVPARRSVTRTRRPRTRGTRSSSAKPPTSAAGSRTR